MAHPDHPEPSPIELPAAERVFAPGQPAEVRVHSEGYTAVEVRAGELDDNALYAFSAGQCHALAAAVHERTGWPVFGLIKDASRPDDPKARFAHFYVRTPDGRCLDATGVHEVREFIGKGGWNVPRGRKGLVPITGDRLHQHFSTEHTYLPPELDVARSFVDSVLGYTDGTRETTLPPGCFNRPTWNRFAPNTRRAKHSEVIMQRVGGSRVRLAVGIWSTEHAVACSGMESMALMSSLRQMLDEHGHADDVTMQHLFVDDKWMSTVLVSGDTVYSPAGRSQRSKLPGKLRADAPHAAYGAFNQIDFDGVNALLPAYLRHLGLADTSA